VHCTTAVIGLLTIGALAGCGSSARPASAPSVDASAETSSPTPVREPGTPDAVWASVLTLAAGVSCPQPVRAVWVQTDWRSWAHLQGEPVQPRTDPAQAVYVVELRSPVTMTCRLCKGIGPPPKGRFSIAVQPVVGEAPGSQFSLGDKDYDLCAVGTVREACSVL
jgi:hypothetical protein